MNLHLLKRLSVSLLVAATLLVAAPTHAAGSAQVTLKISNHYYSLTQAKCTLNVLEGSNGIDVLNAAVASGCISKYRLQTFAFGTFVDCINDTCTSDVRYWAMRENCAYTDYGIDGFRSNHGDELSLTYETWATYAVPVSC